MAIKGGSFLLDNIEKIILPVVGFVCLFLLVSRVLMTPNAVEYEGRKYSPGDIDKRIEAQTEMLRTYLGEEPKPVEVRQEELGEYVSELNDPVEVDTTLWPAVPRLLGEDDDGRQYAVPEAPVISDASAGRIRALAYIPKQEISGEITYESAEAEPGDLDVVTVDARLDVSKLYSSFYETFAGSSVKAQWQDLELARPVFAAVQLQRSRKLSEGVWSEWQDVPRPKIDNMSQLLEVIDSVEELPRGGMKVRLLQYDNFAVMSNILQPRCYDIASAEQEWFPPSLHKKFVSLMKEQQAAERREGLEEARLEREKQLDEARRGRREERTVTRESSSGGGGGGGGGSWMGVGSGASSGRERVDRSRSREDRDREQEELRRRREEEKETINDVYAEFEQLRIKSKTQLGEVTEPLLFWSYDDTAEPGQTYRYRIRLGVFNPLSGTNKLKSGSESYKDKVIIWSNFADAGTVEVPARLYFFAKDIREASNIVTVEVFRYALGYWYSKEYAIEAGEVIGSIDSLEEAGEETEQPKRQEGNILTPEEVDFRTEAMMVDTAAIEDWAGGRSLRPRSYFDMYYSYDGSDIESMPISQRFWSSEIQGIYNEINVSMRQPKKPPRPRVGELAGPSGSGREREGSGGRPSWMDIGPP